MINGKGEQVSSVMEKVEIFNEFFVLVFIASQASHASHVHEILSGCQRCKIPPSLTVEQIRNHL
mgnify:FL=1